MAYLPISAFQRPMTLAQIDRSESASRPALPAISKWVILRALAKTQELYGISASDLSLLQGLLTFHPDETLQAGKEMVIFPSNKTICQRMNGMADSTMRRHLRNLIKAGLLLRRDSNNGKRFALKYNDAQIAFGFDLSPLLARAQEILHAASKAEEQVLVDERLRQELQLMRRDLFAMIPLLPSDAAQSLQAYLEQGRKALRRKLNSGALQELHEQHSLLLQRLKTSLLNNSDSQNEQHKISSNTNIYESEKAENSKIVKTSEQEPNIPLDLVTKACPQLEMFNDGPIHHWSHLIQASHRIYKGLGITESSYRDAVNCLGLHQASIVIAAMLERFKHLRSPCAYLRSLIKKAQDGRFSCQPMIMALLSRA